MFRQNICPTNDNYKRMFFVVANWQLKMQVMCSSCERVCAEFIHHRCEFKDIALCFYLIANFYWLFVCKAFFFSRSEIRLLWTPNHKSFLTFRVFYLDFLLFFAVLRLPRDWGDICQLMEGDGLQPFIFMQIEKFNSWLHYRL